MNNVDLNKKDKFGICRNDICFDDGDIINIPMKLDYTHKQYTFFIKIKEKYKGRRARVNEIRFMFNSLWRINFNWIDGYNENQSEWHLCFVAADFIGCNSLRQSNKKLFGVMEGI